MNNNYYVMRHGKSQANEAGVIISAPETGTVKWGLTDVGRDQISQSLTSSPLSKDTLIYTSDFLRTWESAQIVAEMLGCAQPIKDSRLRERFFGDYEEMSSDNYPLIWKEDEENNNNGDKGVESPLQVQERIKSIIADLERTHRNADILLVSHGDSLQIAQTFFQGKQACEHRSLDHLGTGEVRKLT